MSTPQDSIKQSQRVANAQEAARIALSLLDAVPVILTGYASAPWFKPCPEYLCRVQAVQEQAKQCREYLAARCRWEYPTPATLTAEEASIWERGVAFLVSDAISSAHAGEREAESVYDSALGLFAREVDAWNELERQRREIESAPAGAVVRRYGVDFSSEGGALTLSPDVLGSNASGWTITGEVHDDYLTWVNEFDATHPTLGRVWGNFERAVFATSAEAFEHFWANHPPQAWSYSDI